jgi:hypothetical protein
MDTFIIKLKYNIDDLWISCGLGHGTCVRDIVTVDKGVLAPSVQVTALGTMFLDGTQYIYRQFCKAHDLIPA